MFFPILLEVGFAQYLFDVLSFSFVFVFMCRFPFLMFGHLKYLEYSNIRNI